MLPVARSSVALLRLRDRWTEMSINCPGQRYTAASILFFFSFTHTQKPLLFFRPAKKKKVSDNPWAPLFRLTGPLVGRCFLHYIFSPLLSCLFSFSFFPSTLTPPFQPSPLPSERRQVKDLISTPATHLSCDLLCLGFESLYPFLRAQRRGFLS